MTQIAPFAGAFGPVTLESFGVFNTVDNLGNPVQVPRAIGNSFYPVLSNVADWVAFQSTNSLNLQPGGISGAPFAAPNFSHIYIRDRVPGAVPVDITPAPAFNGASFAADLANNGLFIVFDTYSTTVPGLVIPDLNNGKDIVFYDRIGNTYELISINAAGTGNNYSENPSISATGQFVAFTSAATDLHSLPAPGGVVIPDTNGTTDVLIRNRAGGGTTTLVSGNAAGTDSGNGPSYSPSISGAGNRVAFTSAASNLVAGDTNGNNDIFLRDFALGSTVIVSQNTAGQLFNGSSASPSISENGQYVAFHSTAGLTIFGTPVDVNGSVDSNNTSDIFLRDLVTNRTERISLNTGGGVASLAGGGAQANAGSYSPSVGVGANNNVFVTYWSLAQLDPADVNLLPDAYVTEVDFAANTLVTRLANPVGGATALFPEISNNAANVAYQSNSPIIPANPAVNNPPQGGDANNSWDIYDPAISVGTEYVIDSVKGGIAIDGFTTGDSLVLTGSVFAALSSGVDANDFEAVSGRRGAGTSDAALVYNTKTGALFYNANGDDAGFGVGGGLIAKLTGAPALSYTDFSIA